MASIVPIIGKSGLRPNLTQEYAENASLEVPHLHSVRARRGRDDDKNGYATKVGQEIRQLRQQDPHMVQSTTYNSSGELPRSEDDLPSLEEALRGYSVFS